MLFPLVVVFRFLFRCELMFNCRIFVFELRQGRERFFFCGMRFRREVGAKGVKRRAGREEGTGSTV